MVSLFFANLWGNSSWLKVEGISQWHILDMHQSFFFAGSKNVARLDAVPCELAGQWRNGVFFYDAYLAILNECGEALSI
jgi:hypothetical protein